MDDLSYKQYTYVFNSYENRFKTEDPLSSILQFIEKLERGIRINCKNKKEVKRLKKLKKELELHRDILVKGFDSISSDYLE